MMSHTLLLIGMDQTAGSIECKIVSLATQLSILVGLTWLMLEGIHLFHLSMVGSDIITPTNRKRRRKRRRVSVIIDEQPTAPEHNHSTQHPRTGHHRGRRHSHENDIISDEREESNNPAHQPHASKPTPKSTNTSCCVSRLLSYYVIGWIGPAMFIGATTPTALQGYGRSENCWLATDTEILWVFGAPVPAIFIFHCLATILAISNYKQRIKRDDVIDLDERTKLTDTEEGAGESSRQREVGLGTSGPYTTESNENRMVDQETAIQGRQSKVKHGHGQPTASDDESEEDSNHAYQYVRMNRRHNTNAFNHDEYHDNVMIHPPIYEITERTLAVTLPDDESNEPARNYLHAVYWNLLLIPIVSATWTSGIIAINFRSVSLIYIFCCLNVLQAIYIFIFYCVITFRLRRKWFVMTSREYNHNARPVTVWLGNDPGDDYEVINGRRMGRKQKRRRKIPNIDLMTRTPTPFPSSPPIELVERQTDDSTRSGENIRSSNVNRSNRSKVLSAKLSKSHDGKLASTSQINSDKPGRRRNKLYASVPVMMSHYNDVIGDKHKKEPALIHKEDNHTQRAETNDSESEKSGSDKSRNKIEVEAVAVVNRDSTSIFEGIGPSESNSATPPGELKIRRVTPISATKQTELPGNQEASTISESMHSDIGNIMRNTDPKNRRSYIISDEDENKSERMKQKYPFVKSASDKNIVTQSSLLGSRYSLHSTTSSMEQRVDLSGIISNEPFTPDRSRTRTSTNKSNELTNSRTSSAQGSDKPLISTTPPMRINDEEDENMLKDSSNGLRKLSTESTLLATIHPRKTYDLDLQSGNAENFAPCTPLPRKQSQKFSSIPLPDTPKKNNLSKMRRKISK